MVPALSALRINLGKWESPISTTEVAPIHYEEDQLALEQRLYEESLKVLDEGQVLTGTIVQKDKDEVLVDEPVRVRAQRALEAMIAL